MNNGACWKTCRNQITGQWPIKEYYLSLPLRTCWAKGNVERDTGTIKDKEQHGEHGPTQPGPSARRKITVGGQNEKLRVEKSEKPNEPYVIYHKITGYGKEMRYNLLISSNGLVKCFLIENESLWMLAVDHTYQVAWEI